MNMYITTSYKTLKAVVQLNGKICTLQIDYVTTHHKGQDLVGFVDPSNWILDLAALNQEFSCQLVVCPHQRKPGSTQMSRMMLVSFHLSAAEKIEYD